MRPLVKICGLTRPADARLCGDAGADLLGIIFAPSPRQVTVGVAADIRAACRHAPLVGVFTDDGPEDIAVAVVAANLDVVQLHGCDDPVRWEAVARATSVSLLPAVTAERADAAAAAMIAHPDLPLTGLLLDLPKRTGDKGPEGRVALIEAAKRCRQRGVRVLLAGALDAAAVPQVLREAKPYGLDVCRGVEASPGVKDPQLVARFLAAVDHPEVDRVR